MQFKDFKKGQKIIPVDKTKGLLLVKKISSKEVVLENLDLKKSVTLSKEQVDGGRLGGFKLQVSEHTKQKAGLVKTIKNKGA